MRAANPIPCQITARGTIRWTDDLNGNGFTCRADCTKCERHAEGQISGTLDGSLALMVEQNVMRRLCKGCTEVADANA